MDIGVLGGVKFPGHPEFGSGRVSFRGAYRSIVIMLMDYSMSVPPSILYRIVVMEWVQGIFMW